MTVVIITTFARLKQFSNCNLLGKRRSKVSNLALRLMWRKFLINTMAIGRGKPIYEMKAYHKTMSFMECLNDRIPNRSIKGLITVSFCRRNIGRCSQSSPGKKLMLRRAYTSAICTKKKHGIAVCREGEKLFNPSYWHCFLL